MVHRWLQYWRTGKQLRCYIEEVAEMSDNGRGSRQLSLPTKEIYGQILLLILALIYHAINSLYLTTVSLDEFPRLIHYDGTLFWHCKQIWNIFFISACFEMIYFLYRMYFQGKDKHVARPILLVRQVIYMEDSRYFIRKRYKHSQKLVSHVIRQYTKWYRYVFSYTVPFLSKTFKNFNT